MGLLLAVISQGQEGNVVVLLPESVEQGIHHGARHAGKGHDVHQPGNALLDEISGFADTQDGFPFKGIVEIPLSQSQGFRYGGLMEVPDAPLEEAARIMADGGVGGLPVMDGDRLVGIITETDVFKTILEMMGARQAGVRLTLHLTDEPGALSRITGSIAALGGDIVALGTFHRLDGGGAMLVKVRGVERDALVSAMEAIGIEVADVRQN